MSKILGILMIVLGIWLGLEVYQNGVQGAFGGVLAGFSDSAEERATATPGSLPQRAGYAVERAHAEAEARRARMLDE